jgi:hypothetical protein
MVAIESSIIWIINLVSCLSYSSTLKTEVVFSSETSVHFYRNTRRYISKYGTVQATG